MIYIAVALWYTVTGKPKTETAIKMNFVLQKQLIKNSAPVYTTVPQNSKIPTLMGQYWVSYTYFA